MTAPHIKPVIGWREWIALPELDIASIKVKVDTGARTSALHAYDIQVRRNRVYFNVHPWQRNTKKIVTCTGKLIDYREVRSSSGRVSSRPVIHTNIELLGEQWPIELTLVSRDAMGFRMLLGRQAIRGRFAVDPGQSYRAGKPAMGTRRKIK